MKPPFHKSAFVHSLGGKIYVNTIVRTVDGWGAGISSVSVVSASDPAAVGLAVLSALAASVDDAPNEINPKESVAALLKASGIRSWSQFMSKTKMLIAWQEPAYNVINLTPTRYLGRSKGSAHLNEKSINCAADSAASLGSAIFHAIGLCE